MIKRGPNLGWLRLFDTLGRLGNLTRVAEACGLTQPAVSYQLRRLEEELGVPLVRRLHRGAELTQEGLLLHDAVRESVELIDGAVRQIRRHNRQATIRIHTDFGFASYWLMPRIRDFRRLEPDIEVRVTASQDMDARDASDADLKIMFGQRENFDDTAVQLTEEQVVPVCSPGFLAQKGPFIDAARLAGQTLIHLEGEAGLRWFSWQTWLKQLGVQRRPDTGDLSLNTYNLVIQAALAEQGIALGWTGLIDDLLKSGVLVEAGPVLSRPDRGYWLTSSLPDSPIVGKLTQWLLGESIDEFPNAT